jgi:predicted RNA binding protein YcfA (HicA-like mRNA interferase family)
LAEELFEQERFRFVHPQGGDAGEEEKAANPREKDGEGRPDQTKERAPSCSTKELIRLCEKHGWQQVPGGKGSHVKLKKPGAERPIIIPGNRKRLSPGSLNSTLKPLGIRNAQELPELLAAM